MAKGDMPNATAGIGYDANAPGTMGRFGGGGMSLGGATGMGSYGTPTQPSPQMGGSVGPSPGVLQSILAAMQGGGGMMRNPGMMGAQGPMMGQGFGENTQGRFRPPVKAGQIIPRESSQS